MAPGNLLSVILPAYNEALNLPTVLTEALAFCRERGYRIIVVNDGSRDNTKEVLKEFMDNEYITILHHKLNKGYGAALKTGISNCRTEYCITIDADGQHYLEDIDKLLDRMLKEDADMVVGSRKGLRSSSPFRGIGKAIIRALAKFLMVVPIHDINSGMKLYRTDLAQKYLAQTPDGMSYSDIITLIFINNRHLVLEEPIGIKKRLVGTSTIGIPTAFHTVMEIINIVIYFNPMKIFLPLSVICFILTLAWGVPLILMGRGVSTGTLLGITSSMIFFLLGLIAEQLSLIRRRLS